MRICFEDIKLPPHSRVPEPIWANTCTIHGFKPLNGLIPQMLKSLSLAFLASAIEKTTVGNKTKLKKMDARIAKLNTFMSMFLKSLFCRLYLEILLGQ